MTKETHLNIAGTENRKVCLECHEQFNQTEISCPKDGTILLNVAPDPLVGTTIAEKYAILSVIGQGGMGVVYKARHTLMDRLVAIKMLQAQLISDTLSLKRFQQEGKAASRIKNHPHIITVYDFGITPSGQPFIVMDFLQGDSLADKIEANGQISVERTIKILCQACDALDHAHRQGVVHRDLKPSNIVLTDYEGDADFVKVVDFGVAKIISNTGQQLQRLTRVDEVCGSPIYMSPEQCQGLELDARSDIYSMGIVIYETLTGKLPVAGKTMVETMSKHINDEPLPFCQVRPDLFIPERLQAVIFKALSKDPSQRQQTMHELKRDLASAIPQPKGNQSLRAIPLPTAIAREVDAFHPLSFRLVSKGGRLAVSSVFLIICCAILFQWAVDITVKDRAKPLPTNALLTPRNEFDLSGEPIKTDLDRTYKPLREDAIRAIISAPPLHQEFVVKQGHNSANAKNQWYPNLHHGYNYHGRLQPVNPSVKDTSNSPVFKEQSSKSIDRSSLRSKQKFLDLLKDRSY